MTDLSAVRLTRPTLFFIGVTTAQSSIMKVFPRWAEHLRLGDCEIRGLDFALHDEPGRYRDAVAWLKQEPLARGALVTTHKIDLLNACRDLFDELDEHANLMSEISCISKRGERLRGHAKDPITAGLALEAFLPPRHWEKTRAAACVLGAGGSAIAITWYLMKQDHGTNRPSRIVVANRSRPRLDEMQAIHSRIDAGVPVEYHHVPEPRETDRLVTGLPRHSLVANATGLGKDAPGSPMTDAALFPQDGAAWDFNYRGDLVFLRQARAQEHDRNLHVEDGWCYFLHGWTRVIAEVFDVAIPTSGPEFEELGRIAAAVRR